MCMTIAVLREVCEVATVCVCQSESVCQRLNGEINRLVPLSCFHEVLLN